MRPSASYEPPNTLLPPAKTPPGRHQVVARPLWRGPRQNGRLDLQEVVSILQVAPDGLDHLVAQAQIVGHEGAPE